MKKRTIKSLALNKKSVSNLQVVGGASPLPPVSYGRTDCVSCYPCQGSAQR